MVCHSVVESFSIFGCSHNLAEGGGRMETSFIKLSDCYQQLIDIVPSYAFLCDEWASIDKNHCVVIIFLIIFLFVKCLIVSTEHQ